jgi:hypothetical protein
MRWHGNLVLRELFEPSADSVDSARYDYGTPQTDHPPSGYSSGGSHGRGDRDF